VGLKSDTSDAAIPKCCTTLLQCYNSQPSE